MTVDIPEPLHIEKTHARPEKGEFVTGPFIHSRRKTRAWPFQRTKNLFDLVF